MGYKDRPPNLAAHQRTRSTLESLGDFALQSDDRKTPGKHRTACVTLSGGLQMRNYADPRPQIPGRAYRSAHKYACRKRAIIGIMPVIFRVISANLDRLARSAIS